MSFSRESALDEIRRHVAQFGYHVYVVAGPLLPRFVYSIGLTESVGAELVLAGGVVYSALEAREIVDAARAHLMNGASWEAQFTVSSLGTFSLRHVEPSWLPLLMVGATDYYSARDVSAYQVVPDEGHSTLDIPDLTREFVATREPVWQWLSVDWTSSVSAASKAVTNLDALRGEAITEVARWEEDEWEMFAGPGANVNGDEARVVPLATLLGIDPSLEAVLDVKLGKGLWRAGRGETWQTWGKSEH
jgi:hypothetical protein